MEKMIKICEMIEGCIGSAHPNVCSSVTYNKHTYNRLTTLIIDIKHSSHTAVPSILHFTNE